MQDVQLVEGMQILDEARSEVKVMVKAEQTHNRDEDDFAMFKTEAGRDPC